MNEPTASDMRIFKAGHELKDAAMMFSAMLSVDPVKSREDADALFEHLDGGGGNKERLKALTVLEGITSAPVETEKPRSGEARYQRIAGLSSGMCIMTAHIAQLALMDNYGIDTDDPNAELGGILLWPKPPMMEAGDQMSEMMDKLFSSENMPAEELNKELRELGLPELPDSMINLMQELVGKRVNSKKPDDEFDDDDYVD